MKLICATQAKLTAAHAASKSHRPIAKAHLKNFSFKTLCRISLLIATVIGGGSAQAQFCPQSFDGVTAPTLPAGWTASILAGAVSPWATSTASTATTPNAAFAADPATVSDNALTSPATPVTAANSSFYFHHSYNTESTYDGGVLEISIDGGSFTDLVTAGGNFSVGGYNATISSSFSSPIGGRLAWSGNSGGFVVAGVTLPAAAVGHNVAVRWRATSDASVAGTGWYVDSILCGAAPTPPTPPPSPWSQNAPYPIPITGHAMATVGNAIYSFGGLTTGAVVTASAYRFNGSSWTAVAPLPVAVGFAGVVSDGQYLYIIGGANLSTSFNAAYRYDPATNTYATLAAAPTARWNSAAAFLNGKIYMIGGTALPTGGSATSAVEVYNVAGNNWSTAASYPTTASGPRAFALNQFVYATNDAKAYRYDPVANIWNDAAIADLPQGRTYATIATYHSTAILAGGTVGSASTTSAIQWNAATNTWATLPEMLAGRARLSGGVLKGCFFAVGGQGLTNTYNVDNQSLDCISYSGFEP